MGSHTGIFTLKVNDVYQVCHLKYGSIYRLLLSAVKSIGIVKVS